MAVVGLKDDWNDKDFQNLVVPIEYYSEGFGSCSNRKEEIYVSGCDEYQVHGFNPEDIN